MVLVGWFRKIRGFRENKTNKREIQTGGHPEKGKRVEKEKMPLDVIRSSSRRRR